MSWMMRSGHGYSGRLLQYGLLSPRYVTKQKMFAFTLTCNWQVRQLSFAIIHSTTIALPAWRRICDEVGLKQRLIPRDVVTRWNSTYDMLLMSLLYRAAVDKITADKTLKLRKYELDNDDWLIVEDLVNVLEVSDSRFNV